MTPSPAAKLDRFGPWEEGLPDAERRARLRCMRTLVHLLTGQRGAALADHLRAAEGDPGALGDAAAAIDQLPALDRRQILAAFAAVHRPPRARRP